MFGFRKKEVEKDEAQIFLESVQDSPEMPDPDEAADEALGQIAQKDSKAHYDILNLLVLAVIVIFFGVVFLTLTDHQDFSGENKFTKDGFFSGNYLAKLERTFNGSIPLQDYLHNAESRIKFCFGIGNKTDIIDIKSKSDSDDPYSIENDTADTTPLTDSSAENEEESDESAAETQPPQNNDEDDAGTKKKLDTIKLPSTTAQTSSTSETETTTTVNNASPGATTTTTVPPATTTTTTTTAAAETTTTTTAAPVTTAAPPDETTSEAAEE